MTDLIPTASIKPSSPSLIEQVVDERKPSLRLTTEGKQVAEQVTLSSEDDAQAMFEAVPDARQR